MASGVNLAGYFDSTLGIGHVVRELRKALEAVGVPVASGPAFFKGRPTVGVWWWGRVRCPPAGPGAR